MPPPVNVFTVTTLVDENDSGATVAVPLGTGLSLRQAIAIANATAGADEIVFDASLNGTIRLDGGDGPNGTVGGTLSITEAVTIDGDGRILITGDVGNDDATVDGTDITNIQASLTAGPGSTSTLTDNVRVLLFSGGTLTLDGLTLTGGVASGDGGAVFTGDTVTLFDSIVSGNSSGADGGGIGADTANLTDTTVSGNRAASDGGGVWSLNTTITDSTISGNNAGRGGGIFIDFDANLTNTTVSGNSASDEGGGVWGIDVTLTNVTVSGNTANKGGGIFAEVSGSDATFVNSIVLGNDATTNDEVSAAPADTHFSGRNIVGTGSDTDGSDGVINAASVGAVFAQTVDIDPGAGEVLAGQLDDNGGPVQTIALKGSAANPALDAGDGAAAGVPPADARGEARVDVPGVANNGTNITDIGAFELTHEVVVTTLSDAVDAGDGVVSLREAIALANGSSFIDTITFDASLNGTIRLDGGDGAGGTVGGTLSITEAVTIDGDGRILITGDVNNDDTTVGTTDITDIFTTAATELDDNVRIISATADLTLDGLTLTGGSSPSDGGAIFGASVVTLDNSTVSGNRVTNFKNGGGISAGTVNLNNSIVSDNSAEKHGGGIDAGTANLTNSTVSGNSGADGGGIRASTANLTNSTVSGNNADSGGGIHADSVNLTNTTVSGNHGNSFGGGIFAFAATLTNSTVSGNVAFDGGGVVSATTTANLTNSIVLGNNANTANDELLGSPNLSGGNIVGTDVFQGDTDVGNTTAAAVFAATVDIGGGVLAGVLADNGGPVQTIALKENASNPALDRGDDSLAGVPTNDARGAERADFPGTVDDTSTTDLGAFEVTHDFVVTTLDDVVDPGDGLMSLREAIGLANGNDGADTISFDESLAGGTIRLTHADGTLEVTDELTINGDIDDDGVADILITGDKLGNDATPTGDITDIAASEAVVVGTGTALSDNVRIFDATADLTLDGLTLTGGVTSGDGGAVHSTEDVTLTNAVVSGNRAAGVAGGVFADSFTFATITLTGTTVSGNHAINDGGGLVAAILMLTDSTVSGNAADEDGGGIRADGTATLINSTVSGNSANVNGGGILASTANLTNSTVSGNSAVSDGGGIYASNANLTNSIVLGNDAGTNDENAAGPAGTHFSGLNIVGVGGDTDGSDGVINAASVGAVFASVDGTTGGGQLADNGGPVQTIALKDDLSNPALDRSDNSAPVNDARGEARLDWPGIANANGSAADLGAFELQNAAPTATNLTHTEPYVEDAVSLDLVDILVSDADVGDAITARLTLANPAAGAMTTSGAATYNAGSGVWTITGAVAQVNAALAAVAFKPAANFALDTTIAIHIVDAQGDGPADGTITLDVTPVNDAPAITSNGGGSTVAVLVGENLKPVAIVAATDPDDTPTYAIAGGADAALFAIDPTTGALVFKDAPDFEAFGDTDHDNVYEVTVVATDGVGTDTQAILVTVGDADGATITGTKGKDKVTATETVKAEPLPTGEEDQIDGKGGKDKLSGLDGDDTITGGGGRDVLDGGTGDDTLVGGGGRDKYIGGSGIDSYVFDAHVTPTSLFDHLSFAAVKRRADVIVDYEKDEKIILDSDAFKGLAKGPLSADQFHVGEKAEAFTHRIIYDESAGLLIYDRNGSAVAGDAVIARIGKHLDHLDHNDILVI